MIKKSVVVFGPQGCGKTRNAEALRVHYGLAHVPDNWNSRDRLPLQDTLVLTHESPAALHLDELGLQIVPYADAIAAATA